MLPRHALAVLAGVLCVETAGSLKGFSLASPALLTCLLLSAIWGFRTVGALLAGALWALARALILLNDQLPPELDGTERLIAGDVVSIPTVSAGQVRFDFAPDAATGLPRKLQLTWFEVDAPPRATEHWQLRVRLRCPRGFANPGGFDYEGSLFRDGFGATGYVRDSVENIRLASRARRHAVLAIRAAIADRIHDSLRERPAAGVIAGLAVGATQGISPAQWQVFAATGTTHLIAISGLHVTMVAALAMLIARWLWSLRRQKPARTCQANVACLCGALAAGAYALLAGLSVPTQRTVVMLLVGLATTWLRRSSSPAQVLSIALIAVLVFDPHAARSAGFWLSFVSVAAILAMVGSFATPMSTLRAFFTTQNVVSLALLPATLLLFGSVSLVAPLANVAAIPMFSCLLVPITLLGVLALAVLPALADELFRVAAACLDLLWPALEWAAHLPAAVIYPQALSVGLYAVLVAGALIALLPLPSHLRLTPLVLMPALFTGSATRPIGDFALTVLDVGQGLAVVVRTKTHSLLYDAGPRFRNGRSAGELVVVPYLQASGVRTLDLLVVSHADADHAGGVPAVSRALPVRELRSGRNVRSPALLAATCERGEAWIWDEVRFAFLSPGKGEDWSENEGSCVLEISNARGRVLLTGDIEARVEAHLARLDAWHVSDVIVIPHHGSRSSSSAALVGSVVPYYAIVSAGARNRWHFPNPEVVDRWCQAGAQLINTADWGAITINFSARSAVQQPRSYRLEHQHYWSAVAPFAGRSRCASQNRAH